MIFIDLYTGISFLYFLFYNTQIMNSSKLIFRQLFEKESSTYTYLLGCVDTKEAILIDPVDVTY